MAAVLEGARDACPSRQAAMGINQITTAEMEDFAGLLRRLFRGETVMGHDGPAGRYPYLYPYLRLDPSLDEHLPMSLAAFGENTLKLAGRCFDEVILHTCFTDETVVRCVETVDRQPARLPCPPGPSFRRGEVAPEGSLAVVGGDLNDAARSRATGISLSG
jgi:hypothetical protein